MGVSAKDANHNWELFYIQVVCKLPAIIFYLPKTKLELQDLQLNQDLSAAQGCVRVPRT